MTSLLKSYVESYDVEGLYKYLLEYKTSKIEGKVMEKIIKHCFHLGHIDGPVVLQMLIEFGIAKPNETIKKANLRWVDVCIRNNLDTCLDILVFLGEKKSGINDERVVKIRKMKKANLFKYNVPSKSLKKSDLKLKNNSKWRTWFSEKFLLARKKFGITDEIAMCCTNEELGKLSIVYQNGIFFTPLMGTELFHSIGPLDDMDEEILENGFLLRDVSYFILDDIHLNGSLKVDFCILIEREDQLEVKKEEIFAIQTQEHKPKDKKNFLKELFNSCNSEWLNSKRNSYFAIPEWVESKGSEVENMKIDSSDEKKQLLKKLDEEENLEIKGKKVKEAKAIACFKTKKLIYAAVLIGSDRFKLRSFANYTDRIMDKVKEKGM